MALVDAHGRVIDYLRLSITDRCNLNCRYCRPTFGEPPHRERARATTADLAAVIREAVAAKPTGHGLQPRCHRPDSGRSMYAIGG
jgi:molybdenum cofactor biosynthesis enzyme MoaA